VSQRGEPADVRKQNYQESIGWYEAITADMFARPVAAAPPAAEQKKAG
jgi:Flavocytochrome c sulphide dehydrogenase, flavin-binding